MMETEHPLTMMADYVLDLLPVEERRRVESHARQCATCRQALQQERATAERIGLAVRGAVHTAARPAPGRLALLRPPAPAARPPSKALILRLAPVTLVTFLLALGVLFGPARPSFSTGVFAPQTATAAGGTATATSTHTPTATLAQSDSHVSPAYPSEATQPPSGRIQYPTRDIAPEATPIIPFAR